VGIVALDLSLVGGVLSPAPRECGGYFSTVHRIETVGHPLEFSAVPRNCPLGVRGRPSLDEDQALPER
jgi:hypothetical protein